MNWVLQKAKKYFLFFFRYGGWSQISSFLEILDSIFYLTWFLRIFSPMTNLTLDCFITFSNDWIYLTCFSNLVARGYLTPLFYEDPLIWSISPPFFKFCATSLPPSPSPPTSTSTALFLVLFLWQNRWLYHIWCVILFSDIMDLHMLSVGTLYHKDVAVCFMQQGIKITEVWHIMWYFVVNLIWYHTHTKNTYTQKHTRHTQGPTDWHTHINIC